MPVTPTRARHRAFRSAVAVTAGLGFVACGSEGTTGPASSAATPADAPALQEVSLALDWTPNTDHIGAYVADELGYYDKAGIKLKILPYASSHPDALVNNGKADFGISSQANVQLGRAAGSKTVSVLAIMQKEAGSLITAGDRDDIKRPRDLDGKTYGGFGEAWSAAAVKQIIKHDGGKGEFKNVTLTTAAYEALQAGKVDFSQDVQTWEGVEAELQGRPFKRWQYADYGIPRTHSFVVDSSEKYLEENSELAEKFVNATQRGYALAADRPREAAKLLIKANPGAFGDERLVYESAEMLADEGYLRNEDGEVGVHQPELWSKFGDFLFEQGLLADDTGDKLTEEPDWRGAYTNELVAARGTG